MKFKAIWQVLLIFMVLLTAGEARSETCFMSTYYEKMFEQTALQSESKDKAILVAESDPLTATGKTDHCKDGCHTPLNNGRFDLLLRNAAAEGPDQAPLSARIHRIRVGFQNQEGRLSSNWVHIENEQIADRFGTSVSFKTGRPFDSPKGHSANPEFLEPNENFIGCVSLSKEDRRKTGKAVIEVVYEPTVWMLDLSKKFRTEPFENKILWEAQHEIRDLEQDGIRFYKFTVPNEAQEASDIRIFLDNTQGLEIYSRKAERGWSQNIHDWQAGELTSAGENAGTTFYLLVRSARTSSSGILKAEYTTNQETMMNSGSGMAEKNADVFEPTPVGPPSTQIFKAYALGEDGGVGKIPAN